MHTNVPGIDIAILVLSTNNEKTFSDRGSGLNVEEEEKTLF
jgi:hypothetical protein